MNIKTGLLAMTLIGVSVCGIQSKAYADSCTGSSIVDTSIDIPFVIFNGTAYIYTGQYAFPGMGLAPCTIG